jgi:hypothetical protein
MKSMGWKDPELADQSGAAAEVSEFLGHGLLNI